MPETLTYTDFREAYRNRGVAWTGVTKDGEKPEGWPFMSMDDAARCSAELVAVRRRALHQPVTVVSNLAAVAAVLAVVCALLWWLSPSVLSKTTVEYLLVFYISLAGVAVASAITLAIWEHP